MKLLTIICLLSQADICEEIRWDVMNSMRFQYYQLGHDCDGLTQQDEAYLAKEWRLYTEMAVVNGCDTTGWRNELKQTK